MPHSYELKQKVDWEQMRMGEIQDRGVGGGRGHVVALATNSKAHDRQHSTRARPMYRFADINGRYWPIADISVSVYMLNNKCQY